jgi:hypothetical protein
MLFDPGGRIVAVSGRVAGTISISTAAIVSQPYPRWAERLKQ